MDPFGSQLKKTVLDCMGFMLDSASAMLSSAPRQLQDWWSTHTAKHMVKSPEAEVNMGPALDQNKSKISGCEEEKRRVNMKSRHPFVLHQTSLIQRLVLQNNQNQKQHIV